jgi:hypothetical protein
MVGMCSQVYTIVHAIDPNAIVITPTNGNQAGRNWMGQFFAAGGSAYFDIFSWHYYPESTPPGPPEFMANEVS